MVRHEDSHRSHRDGRDRSPRRRSSDRDRDRERERGDRDRDERKSSSSHHHKRSHSSRYDDERRGSSPRRKSRRDEEEEHHSRSRGEDRKVPVVPPVKIKEEPQSDDERRPQRDRTQEEPRERRREEETERPRPARPRRRSPRSEEAEAANYQYGQQVKEEKEDEPPVEKQKPNFGLSGKLTEETNIFNGVVVKYSEPPEARIPKRRWRFYVFKGEETLPTLYLHRQSAYLIGRDRKVADIPIDHPSCSKQHAVLQFRLVGYERNDGSSGRTVRPYIIDLEAANGTFVNNQKIEPKRYVELFEKDVIKFGFSSREYVLLHEESKAEASLDDLGQ